MMVVFFMIMQDMQEILEKFYLNYLRNLLKKVESFKLNIQNIDFDDEKPVIRTDAQRFIYDKLVIACGAFSKRLTDKLHENIPLDTERGYHVHLKVVII